MNILFICTGNTCRSPMAEAIINKLSNGKYKADSAGINTFPGMPISEKTDQVLREKGIEFEKRSQRVNSELLDWADLIICMERWHKERILEKYKISSSKLKTIYDWADKGNKDLSDPYGEDINEYRKVRDTLFELIKKGINK